MAAKFTSLKNPSVLPGFGLTLGFSLFYLGLVVLIPLAGLGARALSTGWPDFIKTVSDPRVLAAFRITFSLSFIAACINAFFGTILAWVLSRYRFPGRRIMDAMVDLPFALPTAVAGIALTALYGPHGWIGSVFEAHGIKIAFTPTGIGIALVFAGLPFVVRTVQPVLLDFDRETEEAAACLGAARGEIFRHVILPQILPSLITGFAMAFARALGEYGSVIFIAGNMPYKSEIVPLLIVIKLEQYDYAGAAAIAVVMLSASFLLLLIINLLQRGGQERKART